MRGFLGRCELHAFVSQSSQVYPLVQALPSSEQDRRDRDVKLIDEARAEVLLYGIDPTADAYILAVRGLARQVQRLVNTARDEMKRRIAFHLDERARVVSQDEYRHVVGWIVAPPALPVRIAPGPANGSEHVPSENPCADVLDSTCGEVIVQAGRAIARAVHALERSRRKEPSGQVFAAHAEGVVSVLIRPGSEAVK